MEEKAKRAVGSSELATFVGALAMLVSIFLFWEKFNGLTSGMENGVGLYFFIIAVLCFGAFAAKARGTLPGLAFIGLGFAGLALIGNFTYEFFFELHGEVADLREGFYVAGVGALMVFTGGLWKTRGG